AADAAEKDRRIDHPRGPSCGDLTWPASSNSRRMSANVRSGERCNDGESSQSSWSNARAYAREAEAMQACEYRSGMRRVIRDGEAQRAPCRTAFLSNGSFRPIPDVSVCPLPRDQLINFSLISKTCAFAI